MSSCHLGIIYKSLTWRTWIQQKMGHPAIAERVTLPELMPYKGGFPYTVDGRNPAPVDMVNIPLFTRFYTSQVVQDFFHQQYHNSRWPHCLVITPRYHFSPFLESISRYFLWLRSEGSQRPESPNETEFIERSMGRNGLFTYLLP